METIITTILMASLMGIGFKIGIDLYNAIMRYLGLKERFPALEGVSI